MFLDALFEHSYLGLKEFFFFDQKSIILLKLN